MRKATLLVSVQLLCMIVLIYLLPLFPLNIIQGAGMFAGLGLGLWAMLSMRLNTIRVSPVPARSGRLTTNGPYRYIRHPMYTSLLLFFGIWVAFRPSIPAVLVYGVLCVNMIIKLRYEERLLILKYPEYKAYCRETHRLVPLIY